MSKVKIKLKINDSKYLMYGILQGNKLSFLLEKKLVTILLYDNKIVMDRFENDSEYSHIIFDKINPRAYYKYINQYPLNIEITKLSIKKNEFEINYIIEENQIIFKLEYEDVKYDN